ncbi:hypothetical protein E1B28_010244 [Marasmius oreades]|uniref:BTB domain-containing protein n=1 Tax=Marasmius oreades TaxID=181124 RepID=A0A9P7RXD0_9AGAR|nr:uncharacterized protein E1B28_010244 [Marasmius oreades]KAG7091193.1 hypothetical protein E1B28_010244 [Marasmius oreades]
MDPATDRVSKAYERHELFYIDTVVFQVNDTLFKVPSRYLHEQSEVFACASRLSDPNGEGLSDDHPVVLPLPDDATTEDFVQLIKVLYPLTVKLPPPTGLMRDQWISVLKLSTFWELSEIRTLAVSEISKTSLSYMDKIALGRKYRVKPWLSGGLKDLVDPVCSLPALDDMKEKLGTETAMQLLYVRNFQMLQLFSCGSLQEDIIAQTQHHGRIGGNCWRCGKSPLLHPSKSMPTVESLFADELNEIE